MIESKWIPRYFDLFNNHLKNVLATEGEKGNYEYGQLYRILNSTHCKRMMFDSRQAVVFDVSEPVKLEGSKIRPPFGWFWMEMTEPIEIESQQPGFRDKLVGIVFLENAFEGRLVIRPNGVEKVDLSQAMFIFYNDETQQWVDRAWSICLATKTAFTTVKIAEESAKWKDRLPHTFEHQGGDPDDRHPGFQVVSDNLDYSNQVHLSPDTDLFEVGMELKPGRTSSWWERCVQDHTDLLLWVLSYCMAKSVKIEEMKLSRQQRRALERTNQLPRPWHRVFVEPKVVIRYIGGENTGREVGHRFDVIGHLRFNKHKMADGSYRHTVEWVPDHQRGLKNEIYIPKTYAVAKGGKNVPENKLYFGEEPKLHQ